MNRTRSGRKEMMANGNKTTTGRRVASVSWMVLMVLACLIVGINLVLLTTTSFFCYLSTEDIQNNFNNNNNNDGSPTVATLPAADPHVKDLLEGLCDARDARHYPASRFDPQQECIVQVARYPYPPPQGTNNFHTCSPFNGGNNTLFGLPHWCAWAAQDDVHISSDVLRSTIPGMERVPLSAFRAALSNTSSKPGIVIDAGAQVGLYTAAALAAGHYVVSIDIRQEHIQMNLQSRVLNNMTGENHGLVVHGALSNQCGQWATIPTIQRSNDNDNNPGGTHIQGRVSNGWPYRNTLDDFYQLDQVPVVTLDSIMDHVLKTLNVVRNVDRKVLALKMDIEGYEPWAVMGATRLFSQSNLRPKVILMEFFVRHLPHCVNATRFLSAMAQLGYLVTASPRLHVNQCTYPRNACKDMGFGTEKFDKFLNQLDGRAEMDLVLVEA